MSVFDGISTGYDLGLLPLELAVLRALRRRVFTRLTGRVLEVGVGTGVNLPLYGQDVQVVASDASAPMLAQAVRRPARAIIWPAQADVQRLPFANGSFDTVAGSLLFCSVADPLRGLDEVRRVLTPNGRLVLLEHTRGDGLGAWLTDRLHPLWYRMSRECHLNRRTDKTIVQAGFQLINVESRFLGIFRIIEGSKETGEPGSRGAKERG